MRTQSGRRWLLTLIALLLLLSSLPVQAVLAAPSQNSRHAEATGSPIALTVTVPGYELRADGIQVPGYATIDAPGAPALPVWGTLVELPPSGAWTLSYDAPGAQTLDVEAPVPAARVPVPGMPDGAPGVEESDAPAAIDLPDPDIYGADAFYPDAPVVAGPEQWQRGQRFLPIQFFPFHYNPVTGKLRYHPEFRITVTIVPGEPAAGTPGRTSAPDANPPAGNPNAVRIYTGEPGMYRVTYEELAGAGVPVASVSPSTFTVWYLGQAVDIQVTDADKDGSFEPGDRVVFFAEPYEGRYMSYNVYWLTYGSGGGPQMGTRQSQTILPSQFLPLVSGGSGTGVGGLAASTEVSQTVRVEFNRNYRSLYPRPRTADHWFDNRLLASATQPVDSRTYTPVLDDPTFRGFVVVRALVNGRAEPPSTNQSFVMRLNGVDVGFYKWFGAADHIAEAFVPATLLGGNTTPDLVLATALNQIPGATSNEIVPDWIELTYLARADAETNRYYLPQAGVPAGPISISGFTTPDVRVYDVRVPRHPVEIVGPQVLGSGGAYSVRFIDPLTPNESYFASTAAGLRQPVALLKDTPSSLATPGNNAAYIAIVHPTLSAAIQPLIDHRTAEGLPAKKVSVQDVYDEFSYGRVDPDAIKEFLAYAYGNWNGGGARPEFALLVGDGHVDFNGYSGSVLANLIPPYLDMLDPWIGETASDNKFVTFDGPGDLLPEMHIGRIPAQNAADVQAVVNKILAYETTAPPGDWQKRVVYVADNCSDPVADFHALSEDNRLSWLPPGYTTTRAYYGNPASCPLSTAATAAALNAQIRAAYNGQALVVQWLGHGSRFRWGTLSGMFNVFDVDALSNNSVWPVTLDFTCWTGYFISVKPTDDPITDRQTLAETQLLASGKGSVAEFAPSGQHIGDAHKIMNRGVTKAIFTDRLDRLGRALDAARAYYVANAVVAKDIAHTSVLLGDPALKLRLPPAP